MTGDYYNKGRQEYANRQQNAICVQAHAFNDVFESSDLSIFDYLGKFSHELISCRMLEKLLDYWLSDDLMWHIDRGLKLTSKATPITRQGERAVSKQQVKQMSKVDKMAFMVEGKLSVFCISRFKPLQHSQ